MRRTSAAPLGGSDTAKYLCAESTSHRAKVFGGFYGGCLQHTEYAKHLQTPRVGLRPSSGLLSIVPSAQAVAEASSRRASESKSKRVSDLVNLEAVFHALGS